MNSVVSRTRMLGSRVVQIYKTSTTHMLAFCGGYAVGGLVVAVMITVPRIAFAVLGQ